MRFLKYTGIALITVVLCLLIAPFLIDVDHYRTQIEHRVEDATGRALHIGGMQASLFPWVGLKLEDVTFANGKGFDDPNFLKVGRLDVKLAVMPLLQKKIELKRFELDAPELHLQRNREGVGNWEDLLASNTSPAQAASATPAESSSPMMAGLIAETIQLTHGQLSWQDDRNGQKIALSNVQLTVLDVQQTRPIIINAAVSLADDTVALEGKVGPIGDFSRLDATRLPVQLSVNSKRIGLAQFSSLLPELPAILGSVQQAAVGLDAHVEQRPDGSRAVDGSITLDAAHDIAIKWVAEQIDPEHIRLKSSDIAFDGTPLLHSKGQITLPDSGAPTVEMQLSSEKISRTWLTKLLPDLDALYGKHPAPWQDLDIGMVVKAKGDIIELRDMKMHLNQELLIMSGRLVLGNDPDIHLRMKADQLHLDPWLPFSEENATAAKGSTPATAATEPDLRSFSPWRINLQVDVAQLYAKQAVLDHVVVDLQGNDGMFTIKPLAFGISGGRITEQASLNVADYPATWHESMTVKNVEVGPLLKQFADSDQFAGALNMSSKLYGQGLLPGSIKASLTGNGNIEMLNGKVKGFDIANALRNITSLGQKKGPQYTDFAQLQASFTAKQGILTNDDLFMASPLFRLTGKGSVNLPASTMDYHMRPKLVATLVGQGDQSNARKGVTIPLHIHGPFESPSITPELDTQSIVSGVQDALKGGNPLKNLGSQNPAADVVPANPTQAAKDKVNKALGGLIPGF